MMRTLVLAVGWLLLAGTGAGQTTPAKPSAAPASAPAPAPAKPSAAPAPAPAPAPAATSAAKPEPPATEAAVTEPSPWRVGFGGRLPDGILLEVGQRITAKGHLRYGLALPVGTKVTESAEKESDTFFGELTIVTPPASVDVDVVYGPNLSVDYVHFPWTKGFFASFGLLYYRAGAYSEKSSPLYICVEATASCEPETAPYRTNGQVHVEARLRSTGYKARLGAGWRWEPGRHAYIDLTALGLAYTVSVKRTADVSSSLDDDPALSSLSKEQAVYLLERKEAKLEAKARGRMEAMDKKTLPFAGLTAGFRF